MELPPFDILWQTSDKLSELESVLDELDRISGHQKASLKKRRRQRRDGLYGIGFNIEDRDYYEPFKYCCEEAFYTEFAYANHVAAHIKCESEGCQYIADAKNMRVHKEMVHESTLCDEIDRQSSNKSVLEWKEARKRNYPTAERIATKRELLEQRIARGQIFKTPEFGWSKKKRQTILSDRDLKTASSVDSSTASPPLKPGADVKSVQPDEGSDSPDHVKDIVPLPSSLVAYDCDSDGAASDHEASKPQSTEVQDIQSVASASGGNRGRRRRGGKHKSSTQTATAQPSLVIASQKAATRERNPFTKHPVVQILAKRRAQSAHPDQIMSRPTLLHMLLAEEMRKERNQLMQCIRYVVKHNFFMNNEDRGD